MTKGELLDPIGRRPAIRVRIEQVDRQRGQSLEGQMSQAGGDCPAQRVWKSFQGRLLPWRQVRRPRSFAARESEWTTNAEIHKVQSFRC